MNQLDGEDKEYGYIIDYKICSVRWIKAITDYTTGAFDDYDQDDVAGLLKDRLEQAQLDLDSALEMVSQLM